MTSPPLRFSLRWTLTLLLAAGGVQAQTTAQTTAPQAQATAANTLTLEAALAQLAQAPSVTQAQLSVQVAQRNLDAARSALGLSISVTGNASYTGPSTTAADGTATAVASSLGGSAGVQASLGLLPWSSAQRTLQAAQRNLALAQARLAEAQASARLNVYQQYFAAVLAQQDVTLSQQALALRQRQLEVALSQQAQANATQESVLSAQANVQLAQSSVLEAQESLETARLNLAAVLGRDLTGVVFGSLPASSFSLPDLGALVARARRGTSAVIEAQNNLAAAQETLAEQQRDVQLPDLTTTVRYGPAGSGGLSASLNLKEGSASVGYSLPLGSSAAESSTSRVVASLSGGYVVYSPALRAQLSAAEASVTQAQLTLNVTQQNAELEVRTRYSAAQSALTALPARSTQVEVARAALQAAQARLQAGTGTADDVTAAELNLAQARRALVQARANAQIALIQLAHAAGGSL
ncbi:TolC family protein [Deinococcus sp. YIM 77859]|uniref:TolC family protein n=1 Tax=Deinococcus sp. YIM 77859 TaxID=1540221 RepID=UPI0005593DC0|nr:TolC family protein [Deinococcus sp. YIM 77859]